MKNLNTIKLLAVLFISTITLSSCSDSHDDDDHEHGEELITTVTYTLTSGNDVVTLTFKDLDGEGGLDGTTTISGPLKANTTYTGAVSFLNETESPTENITEEVIAEGDEHEVFYTTTVSGLTISKTDDDKNGDPLGIETSLTTSNAATGTITIVLIHEPLKPNNGTSTSAGGSTDAEVTFAVQITQ